MPPVFFLPWIGSGIGPSSPIEKGKTYQTIVFYIPSATLFDAMYHRNCTFFSNKAGQPQLKIGL